jgi:hypothetical protein
MSAREAARLTTLLSRPQQLTLMAPNPVFLDPRVSTCRFLLLRSGYQESTGR